MGELQPTDKSQLPELQFHWWDFSPELLIECAPLGKIARLIHYHLSVKPLPMAFVACALLSIIPACIIFAAHPPTLIFGKDIADALEVPAKFTLFGLLAVLMFILVPILLKPTHIGVGRRGIRLHWRRSLLGRYSSRWLEWDKLSKIDLHQPATTTLAEQQILRFRSKKGEVAIRIGQIVDPEQFPLLWEAISVLGKNVPRDFELGGLLGEGAKEHSYTELWLKALAAPPERDRLTPLPAGACIKNGEYIITGRIGSGGQGIAYAAGRKQLMRADEQVVLKEYVLPIQVSRTARTQAVERLEKEARILEQIRHKGIVRLIDFFFEDHRGYLVLEHISGTPLSKLVRQQGPLSETSVRELIEQMCDILHHLHTQSPPVIHRDFTPDNLILSKDGTLKLIDFNVAEQKASNNTTATVVGKHAYIAPEQFRGKPVTQSDIYSMGATIFFLLCGRDPKPISIAHPKTVNPAISDEIDKLVADCTAINTPDRLSDAQQVRASLKKISGTSAS